MKSLWKRFLHFLTSARVAIFLLLFLAIACTIGTLLPQNQNQEIYLKLFGKLGTRIIHIFSLYDVYHAPWFQFLLIFLGINLIACSLDRLPKTLRLFRYQEKRSIDKKFFQNLSFSEHFVCPTSLEKAKQNLISLFKKEFGNLQVINNPKFSLHAQKGKISYFGPYIIHTGILIILFGGLISSLFGFSGMMFIPEGKASNTIFLQGRRHHQRYNLPFSLKCEKFIIEYYPNGMPKEYLSKVTVIDGEKTIKKDITVNGPLDYKGLRFYQATYGVAPEPTLTLEVINRETNKHFLVTVPFNQSVSLPDSNGYVKLVKAFPEFMNAGIAFQLEVSEDGRIQQTWVFEKFPNFDAMHRKGKYIFRLKDYSRYTGLQVKKDLGVWIIWGGCIILVLGLMISFFIIPQRIWLHLAPHPKGCEIWLGGTCVKRKVLFRQTFQNWVSKIKEVLPCGT